MYKNLEKFLESHAHVDISRVCVARAQYREYVDTGNVMIYVCQLGTNFKINSGGQLRHFNCTILARAGGNADETGSGGRKESGREREAARGRRRGGRRRKTDRGCAARVRRRRGGGTGDGRAQEMTDRAHTRIIIITLLDRDGGERRARSARLRRALKYYTYQRENN